jgi:hypothetical protein
MIVEDGLPAHDRLRGRAPRPGLRGSKVAPLALGATANRRFGRAERVHDLGMVAAKPPDHEERRNRDAAQGETGIARERRLENADRVARQPVIVGDRAIERGG